MGEKYWLIRKIGGQIQGPFPYSMLKNKLQQGEISFDSEICPENGYWFSFHDIDDMKANFTTDEISHAIQNLRQKNADLDPEDLTQDLATTQRQDQKSARATAENSSFLYSIEKGQILTLIFVTGIIIALYAVAWIIRKLTSV